MDNGPFICLNKAPTIDQKFIREGDWNEIIDATNAQFSLFAEATIRRVRTEHRRCLDVFIVWQSSESRTRVNIEFPEKSNCSE